MIRMIELTDLVDSDNETYAVVPVHQVAMTIRSWHPAHEHVRPSDLESADELQEALIAEDFETARDIAAEIAVGFDEAQPCVQCGSPRSSNRHHFTEGHAFA